MYNQSETNLRTVGPIGREPGDLYIIRDDWPHKHFWRVHVNPSVKSSSHGLPVSDIQLAINLVGEFYWACLEWHPNPHLVTTFILIQRGRDDVENLPTFHHVQGFGSSWFRGNELHILLSKILFRWIVNMWFHKVSRSDSATLVWLHACSCCGLNTMLSYLEVPTIRT